ncbi:hypothetical protein AB0M29_15105 [Streptomyces sp. NPDC051976]
MTHLLLVVLIVAASWTAAALPLAVLVGRRLQHARPVTRRTPRA